MVASSFAEFTKDSSKGKDCVQSSIMHASSKHDGAASVLPVSGHEEEKSTASETAGKSVVTLTFQHLDPVLVVGEGARHHPLACIGAATVGDTAVSIVRNHV